MKYAASTLRGGLSARARVLLCAATFAVAPYWCCPAESCEAGDPSPDRAVPSFSTDPDATSDADSIPHGIVRPRQRATMSAPLQGMLVEVLIEGGDRVEKGQILAVMDNRVAKAAVGAARAAAERTAEIEHAKHALALAESLLARHNALHDADAGAEFELEQARARRDQARATLASAMEVLLQAERRLELEETRLEIHNVRAPFDGRVMRVDATVGTTLSPADKLLSIVCLDTLEAELHLPLELFGRLHAGESYRLWAFAPVNGPVRARLASSPPMVDPASRSFRCVFTIDNQEQRLPTGFAVRLETDSDVTIPR